MTSPPSRRGRGLAALAGLLGAAVLLVVGKAATAPPPTKAALAAPTPAPAAAPPPGATTPPATSTPATSTPTPSAPTTPPATPSPALGATGTYLGTPVDVGYGIVQVQVTLTGGRITDVRAVRLPSGGRSSEIAAYAAPRLRSEVLVAQSAHIDTVSGASFTSDGYARSVQAALDAAPR